MKRKSLFDGVVLEEMRMRIGSLTEEANPEWGTMTVGQMLAHCSEVLEVMAGKPLQDTPFSVMLFKGMIRKVVVGDKPYPRSSRTHPQYVIEGKRDLVNERNRLMQILDNTFVTGDVSAIPPHVLFGVMTPDEIGWSSYKHLDHHLRQFGV